MGLRDIFRRKPMWDIEQERRARYEHKMAQLGYSLTSAKRQESLAKRQAEIARLTSRAHKLTTSSKPTIPNYAKIVTNALDFDPFATPKKRR